MTASLYLAYPTKLKSVVSSCFGKKISLIEMSNSNIAKQLMGNQNGYSTSIVSVGSSSWTLVMNDYVKLNHNNDHKPELVDALNLMMQAEDCHTIAFLYHWLHGDYIEEQCEIQKVVKLELDELPAVLNSGLEENVKYVLVSYTHEGNGTWIRKWTM